MKDEFVPLLNVCASAVLCNPPEGYLLSFTLRIRGNFHTRQSCFLGIQLQFPNRLPKQTHEAI